MGAIVEVVARLTNKEPHEQTIFYQAYKISEELMIKLSSVGIGKKELYDLHRIFDTMDKGR